MPLLAATIFLSAFLLLLVQPLIGKYILPWFGGSPAVWTTCMLFFQISLLAGYVYAHVVVRLPGRMQAGLHIGLLAAAAIMLPIAPDSSWKPEPEGVPTSRILLLLGASIGLPYFMLSTTGPLVQVWARRAAPSRSPYWLYALSNAASLLALVAYPFALEPTIDRIAQAWWWSAGFVAFAIMCSASAIIMARSSRAPGSEDKAQGAATASRSSALLPVRLIDRLMWAMLSACGTTLLLAVTNQLCQDVAVVPFLWLLPLAIYLLTFILCFQSERLYWRPLFIVALVISLVATALMIRRNPGIVTQIAGYSFVLFTGCMVCHGELYRLRPAPRELTGYYMLIALGGAMGGVFVAVLAPVIFTRYLELPIGLVAAATLLLIAVFCDPRAAIARGRPRWLWLTLVLAFLLPAAMLWQYSSSRSAGASPVAASRNFYGILAVQDKLDADERHYRELRHGQIMHGVQLLGEQQRSWPTSYYAHDSGVGLTLDTLDRHRARRVGIVGLGTGTLATFGRPGDVFRFYEINPAVARIAREHFTYLADSDAKIDIVPGDARLSMEREAAQRYDVLVLDAFSSDAIPVHLLTAEAFDVYRRHVDLERGVIAVHISNHHLDLRPVLRAAARRLESRSVLIRNEGDDSKAVVKSHWILLTNNQEFLESKAIQDAALHDERNDDEVPWTDDFSNLLSILK